MKEAPRGYTTKNGFTFELDGSLCLPPDDVSEHIGNEVGRIVNTIKHLSEASGQSGKVVRILELGVGSGIGLISAFEEIADCENVEFHGIDINEYSVNLTATNLGNLALKRNTNPKIEVWQADWFDEATWERLSNNQYHVALFNPPYFASGSRIRDKHKPIPVNTMITDDSEGLMHYRQVMPRLHKVLSNEPGSAIIIRRRGKADENDENFVALQETMQAQIGDTCRLQTTKFLLPYGKFAHYVTATVGQ